MLDQPSTDHGHELADEYARSRYVRRRPEHWIPSGISLYSGISHLRPNHLLTLPDLQVERYYPEHRSTEGDGSSVFDAAEILRGTMRALCNRTRVAVALSAGIDSRTVLAATRDLRGPDLTYHSYVFRKLTRDSPDVLIPRRLSRRLRLDHAEIRADQAPTGAFASAYERNVTNGHLAAWGPLVLAYSEALPSDTVIVDGGASEIARRSGSRLRPFPPGFGEQGHTAAAPTAADGASLVPGWRSFPRFIEVVEHWMDESKPVLEDAGYDPLDFFYWEFRVGSWLAQAYREYDIAQERFSPFSSRRLIELLLAHEPTERSGQLPRCHQEICGLLWPAVLELPVNPPTTSKRARDPFVDVLTSVIRPNGRPLRPTRLPGSGRGR